MSEFVCPNVRGVEGQPLGCLKRCVASSLRKGRVKALEELGTSSQDAERIARKTFPKDAEQYCAREEI